MTVATSVARSLGQKFDDALSGVGLGALSLPAKIIVSLVAAAGVILAWLLFVIDSFSENPSSTAALVLLVPLIYVPIAVLVIAGSEWTIRRLARRVRRGRV
jgi:hypothetical protein